MADSLLSQLKPTKCVLKCLRSADKLSRKLHSETFKIRCRHVIISNVSLCSSTILWNNTAKCLPDYFHTVHAVYEWILWRVNMLAFANSCQPVFRVIFSFSFSPRCHRSLHAVWIRAMSQGWFLSCSPVWIPPRARCYADNWPTVWIFVLHLAELPASQ